MFDLLFILIAGFVIFSIIKQIGEWHQNNQSPRLNVQAVVAGKEKTVSHHHDANGHMHRSTTYHITFQVQSGDLMKFTVRRQEYNSFTEGMQGELYFQGTRYLGFQPY